MINVIYLSIRFINQVYVFSRDILIFIEFLVTHNYHFPGNELTHVLRARIYDACDSK